MFDAEIQRRLKGCGKEFSKEELELITFFKENKDNSYNLRDIIRRTGMNHVSTLISKLMKKKQLDRHWSRNSYEYFLWGALNNKEPEVFLCPTCRKLAEHTKLLAQKVNDAIEKLTTNQYRTKNYYCEVKELLKLLEEI